MADNPNILNFQDLLDRVIAICTETISGSEGFAFWYVANEHYPYFIARVADIDPTFEDSDEIVTYKFKLFVRHITGNRTEGMTALGEAEGKLYTQIPLVLNAFLSSELFQSTAESTAPDWLESFDMLPCAGLQSGDASGIGAVATQIFTTYQFECSARVQIDFAFD